MKNLLNTLSQGLQDKLADFKVSIIFIEDKELNIRSDWDLNSSYVDAIQNELIALGHEIED